MTYSDGLHLTPMYWFQGCCQGVEGLHKVHAQDIIEHHDRKTNIESQFNNRENRDISTITKKTCWGKNVEKSFPFENFTKNKRKTPCETLSFNIELVTTTITILLTKMTMLELEMSP